MNRLEAMSTLLAAVDAGSLSAASRKLGVPLATVSRRVSDLEAYLGATLIVRTSRRLELTDAGRSYVAACREILEYVTEAERAASGEYAAPQGEIVITAPIVFGRLHVLPVVVDYLNAYPDINVRLVQTDRIASFTEDHVDVAIRIGPLPDSDLIAKRVGSVRRVVCASPDYLARHGGKPLHPRDLERLVCISFEGLNAPNKWTFSCGKKAVTATIGSRLVVNTAEAAIDAANKGLGVTRVLSYQVAESLKTGALTTLLDDYEPEPWPVHLLYASQGLLPLKTRAFVDFAASRLRKSLDNARDMAERAK